MTNVTIRAEQAADIAAIERITVLAFRDVQHSDQSEHEIVNRLREAGALTISLVAEVAGQVIGHVAISPVEITDGSCNWYGLGPVSVVPEQQSRGVGSQLIFTALAQLQQSGAAGCVVLGEPGYYQRFGFRPEADLVLADVPAEYFQARAFTTTIPRGFVHYHSGFGIANT